MEEKYLLRLEQLTNQEAWSINDIRELERLRSLLTKPLLEFYRANQPKGETI